MLLGFLYEFENPPASALVLLGVAIAKQNRFSESEPILRQALAKDDSNIEGWNWLSIVLRNLCRFEEAWAACDVALSKRKGDAGTYFNLGLCSLAAGEFSRAVKELNLALSVFPENPQVLQNLGLAYQGAGEDDLAIASFQKAIRLAPKAPEPRISLGNLFYRQGNLDRAKSFALEALGLDAHSVAAHLLAHRAIAGLDEYDKAESHLVSILKVEPNNDLAWAMLGSQKQQEGDFQTAAEFYERSVELNPCQGFSYWGQVNNLQEATPLQPEFLHKIAEECVLEAGERSYLYYSIGKLLENSRDYSAAMENYDRANSLAHEAAFGKKAFDIARLRTAYSAIARLFSSEFLCSGEFGNQSNRPIFIAGMIRSGTTLMEQILSSHPDVSAAGETRFWIHQGSKAIDLAGQRVDSVKAPRLGRDFLNHLDRKANRAKFISEKTPENLQMLGLIHMAFPNAKLVLIERNAADNCLSIYTTPYALPPEYAYRRDQIAAAYKENRRLANHWKATIPKESLLCVPYEQLTQEPVETIRSVLLHCGLSWSDRCLRPEDNPRQVSTPSLWQVRQPIHRRSTERWRHYQGLIPEFEELLASPEG